tara:strand:- start:354 stop:1625 length:1272 start_codon:yes stop_codon:yes gene_type:complete
MDKKIKIFTLSDHPLSPSGVGTQTRYMIEEMLKTGKYQFVSFGGAIKHHDYRPTRTEEFGDDWIIYPVDGYGDQDSIRSVIWTEKPDVLWFMTDPRFWGWLWQIENEIRANVPMVYYHVWDNRPYPNFNKSFYDSNDNIACISKLTYEVVQNVSPDVESSYLPHTVNTEIFKKLDPEVIEQFRETSIPLEYEPNRDRVLFFWNNRNARRKQSGTVVWWFKEFLDIVGHNNAALIMHTETDDVHGQDLEAISRELGLNNGQLVFSRQKVPAENLALAYNMCDCTINIADAEGFGLATLESLACEVPIIVTMTGGLQEQVTDGENWFGFGLEPAAKAIIGSQEVPYIYEDRVSKEDFLDAMVKFYNMTKEERAKMGAAGRNHVLTNYSFEKYRTNWDNLFTKVHEECGSWATRKNYQSWEMKEIK